jgi:outer membrane receptor protein involved in Fe transport
MKSRSRRVLLCGISHIALAGLIAGPAFAQEPATTLDAIVVTGEKTSRSLKDTASSVSVTTARDIKKEKSGDSSVHEAISDVSNVLYPDSVSSPVIRGQDSQGPNTGATAFFAGTVPRATINLDGHYLNYNEFYFGTSSIWDVDSIEVFRGPQTTSQGANAIAGAIVVNTKDPTFTPEASYLAEIGNYNSRRAAVAFSGPLVEDELAGRIAIDYSGRDTFIDYVNSGFKHAGTDQSFSSFTGRAKLLWEPSAVPGLSAKLTYSYNTSNRPSQEAASTPFEDLKHITTTMPSWRQYGNTGVLDLNYDMDHGLQLTNQTQLSSSHVVRSTGLVNNGDAVIDQTNVSNETRLKFGDEADVLSGFVGLYYAHTKADEVLYLSGTSTFDDTKDNLGLFSELTYRLDDQWSMTGGLRYQHDWIQRKGLSVYSPDKVDFNGSFSAFLPKVSLAFAATPEWTLGAMVSRGYNPGGVSLNLSSKKWMEFKEESVWNYELFTRANLLDDQLTLTANVFYMDFKNAQYNIPVVVSTGVTQSYTINAERAHAYGLEVGAEYQALSNLKLKGSAGVLRTRIDEISSNVAMDGNQFAKSPGYMLSFGATYDVTEKFSISGQIRHIDGYYSDTANTPAYAIKPYTVVDARASYSFSDKLEAYGYVKNIFDNRAATYMQVNRGIGGIEASMTTPRMFGAGIRGTF